MSKLRTMLGAFTLAFSIGGIAAAADDTNTNQQSQQPQTKQTPATAEQRELEYFSAVTKCERIANDDKKQKCFDAARNKHGQM